MHAAVVFVFIVVVAHVMVDAFVVAVVGYGLLARSWVVSPWLSWDADFVVVDYDGLVGLSMAGGLAGAAAVCGIHCVFLPVCR